MPMRSQNRPSEISSTRSSGRPPPTPPPLARGRAAPVRLGGSIGFALAPFSPPEPAASPHARATLAAYSSSSCARRCTLRGGGGSCVGGEARSAAGRRGACGTTAKARARRMGAVEVEVALGCSSARARSKASGLRAEGGERAARREGGRATHDEVAHEDDVAGSEIRKRRLGFGVPLELERCVSPSRVADEDRAVPVCRGRAVSECERSGRGRGRATHRGWTPWAWTASRLAQRAR